MNIDDLAVGILELVQNEIANKSSTVKMTRQVKSLLHKFVAGLTDTDADYVLAINMHEGLPHTVTCNNPALNGALFVCTDNISVADDEESAIIVYDDNIVVGIGNVSVCSDVQKYIQAARKFDRDNN